MGFLDKMKDAADKVKETYKEEYEKNKKEREEKKAAQEAYAAEMREKVNAEAEQRIQQISSNFSGINYFDGIDDNQLLKFTKDFFDKIVLPAISLSSTCIEMYPHIEGKSIKKIKNTFPNYDDEDIPIIYLRAKAKAEILITQREILFSDVFSEDNKYRVAGKCPLSQVGKLSVKHKEEQCIFLVNDVELFSLEKSPVYERDFISLEKYMEMIEKRDFDITDEETDAIIREKIGAKVYQDAKRKMTYDDELILYFAWGLDSLSAKDYICCTDKQIIYLDREMGGATANVKQFYYEDITSMATLQNSQSSSLTGYLIDTALTSALALCDLEISVAGNVLKINTLKKIEADRVVEIYHQRRKQIKDNANQPHVIVQQSSEPDVLEQLEKLNKLKEAGILTEDEFNAKKADLLAKL